MFHSSKDRLIEYLLAENARLISENRKLVNAIMPRLGYDPLDEPKPKETPKPKPRLKSWRDWAVAGAKRMAKQPRAVIISESKESNGQPS